MAIVWAVYSRHSIDKNDPDPSSNGTSCLVRVKRKRKRALVPSAPVNVPRTVQNPTEAFNPVLGNKHVVVISGNKGYARVRVVGRLKSSKEFEQEKQKKEKRNVS